MPSRQWFALDLTIHLVRWLTVQMPLVWLCIGVVIGVWCASEFISSCDEQTLRIAGTALQLCGIGAVARDIRSKRIQFRLDSLLDQAKSHLAALSLRQDIEIRAVTGTLKISTKPAGVMAFGTAKPGTDAPIEQRIAWLESQRELDAAAIHEAKVAVEQETRARTKALEEMQREHQRQVISVYEDLKKATTGTLSFAVVGLVWLAIGVIFGTAAADIAPLLG